MPWLKKGVTISGFFWFNGAMPLSTKALVAPPALAIRAATALRRKLLRAADLVVPAEIAVLQRIIGVAEGDMMAEIARLGVPDLLERGALTAAEIAARTGTNADAMARTLRALQFCGLFTRGADGRWSNNRLSRALLDDPFSMRAFATYFGSRSNKHAWSSFSETLRTGKNAFEHVHGKSVWTHFDEHPEERETFALGMMSITLMEVAGIATTYPFGAIGKLCDVGGGRGTLMSELLLHHPNLRGVLLDAPGVLESAKSLLATRGVLDRVDRVPGSFFDEIPAGADAYLLKNVLHDWDDARSEKILKNVRAAMRPGQPLLVIETLLEEDSDNHTTMVDVHMMVVCDEGRERGRADFERLFAATGFRYERALQTPTGVSIIEAIAH